MFTVVVVSGLLVFILLVGVRLNDGRVCRATRTVLLGMPLASAWGRVRDFGALQVADGGGRPPLHAESSELVRGDGHSPGSVWRQRGRWGRRPWWAEIELVAFDPPHRIEITLLRDVFGTRAGLAYHSCIIDLRAVGQRATRVRFRLRARTRGARLTLARTFSPERLYTRMLDLGLRSIAIEADGAPRAGSEVRTATAAAARSALRPGALPVAGLAAARQPPATPTAHDQA